MANQQLIGECKCLYSDQKNNILVALDAAIVRHQGLVQSIRNNEKLYIGEGINPRTLIEVNLGLVLKFEDTRNKVKNTPECK